MKICIYGMGAIGGHMGARLGAAGHDISAVARGANLAAIRKNGIALHIGDETVRAAVNASDNPAELGPQDLVISTLKATGIPDLAAGVETLLGPDTAVIFAQNGIPWWYDIGLSPDRPPPPDLSRLDPDGAMRRAVGPERVIGGVIVSPNEMTEPGVVRYTAKFPSALSIGEIDDSDSPRIRELRAVLIDAGVDSPPVADIRQALWSKLINNMTASIFCLITGSQVSVIRTDPRISEIFVRAAHEAIAIAAAHGVALDYDPQAFIKRAPDHTPSVRQDYDMGRQLELDALLMMPVAFGRAAGLDTPCLDTISALAAVQGRDKGLYSG